MTEGPVPGHGPVMSAEACRAWRVAAGLTQSEAADRLGLKRRMVQYYEKGARGAHPVVVPRSVRLACYAIGQGVADFDGRDPVPGPGGPPPGSHLGR